MYRKTRCIRSQNELLLKDYEETEYLQEEDHDEDHDEDTPTPRQMRLVIEWGTEIVARFE